MDLNNISSGQKSNDLDTLPSDIAEKLTKEDNIALPEVVIKADKTKIIYWLVGSLALYGAYKLFSKWVR